MSDNIKYEVTYKDKTYSFSDGALCYIFDMGVYNELDRKYSRKQLLEYVWKVHDCYCSDSNQTPLGALCDYVAEHWRKLKSESRYDILDNFYEEFEL